MRYFIVRKDGWPAVVREDQILDGQDLRPVAVCETREGALGIAEALTRRAVARRGTLARLRWALRSLMRGTSVAVVGGSSYRPSR
jgi:hypothetical protein